MRPPCREVSGTGPPDTEIPKFSTCSQTRTGQGGPLSPPDPCPGRWGPSHCRRYRVRTTRARPVVPRGLWWARDVTVAAGVGPRRTNRTLGGHGWFCQNTHTRTRAGSICSEGLRRLRRCYPPLTRPVPVLDPDPSSLGRLSGPL